MKNAWDTLDYRRDSYSGIMAVKLVNNSMINLESNFVEIESFG